MAEPAKPSVTSAPLPSPPSDGASLAAIVGLVLGTVVLAAALPAARTGPVSTPSAFQNDATCLEWTDDCVICKRGADKPSCSTPGIACERRAPRCLMRTGS